MPKTTYAASTVRQMAANAMEPGNMEGAVLHSAAMDVPEDDFFG
jgi:hypothetical protein